MNILCIDFGLKRIGVARSIGDFAEPVRIVENSEKALSDLADLCEEFQIETIVFGLSENTMAELTKEFAQKLGVKVNKSIQFIDETLSSQEVEKMIRQRRRIKPGEAVDHYVAAYLLEQFLESLSNSNV